MVKDDTRAGTPSPNYHTTPLAGMFFEIHSSKIYGSTGSMMSILEGKANSFVADIAFSADCKDSEFEISIRKRFEQMETDPPPPNPEDLEKCSRILDIFEYQIIKKSRLAANQHILYTMNSGITRKNLENYNLIEKENRKLTEEIEDLEGELTLIGSCPIENCQYHSKLNSSKIAQKLKESSKQLELDFKKPATNTCVGKPPHQKKNRLDGFIAPTKVVKKQKVLQNYSFDAADPLLQPINTRPSLEMMSCRLRATQRCQLPPQNPPHSP
ncbi:hypothetical protein TNCV_607871 [Trichonephila clavipes]|nr:hypothetical protein TNCV_607871 [Trichonephila clavipes]